MSSRSTLLACLCQLLVAMSLLCGFFRFASEVVLSPCCRCPSQMDRHLLTHHTWRLQRFEMPTERGQSNDALCQILHQSNSLIVLEVGVRRDLHTSTAVIESCWLPFMICWIIPMTPPVAASFLCSLKLRGRGPARRLHVEALRDLQEAAKRY